MGHCSSRNASGVVKYNKDNGYSRPEQRTPDRVLDPISDEPVGSTDDAERKGSDEGQIAVPNRGSTQKRGSTLSSHSSKGPPTSWSAESGGSVHDDDEDSAYSASTDSIPSRHGIRSSDTNKSQQPFDQTDKRRDVHSQGAQNESVFRSGTSIRVSSGKRYKGDSLDINENRSTVHAGYSPNSSVTGQENHASDDRQRVSKGMSPKEQSCMGPPRSSVSSGAVDLAGRGTGGIDSVDLDSTTAEEDSEDDAAQLAKSSSFKHSIFRRQQERKKEQEEHGEQQQEQANEQQCGREDGLQQEQEWPQETHELQQEKLKKPNSRDSLSEALSISRSNMSSLSNQSIIRTAAPRPVALVLSPRQAFRSTSDLVSSRPVASEPEEELKPFSDPEAALRAAHKKLGNEDWEVKTEGLNMIRRIVHFHPETFSALPALHSTVLLVIKEVKNLRSQVSRLGIVCLGDMFVGLKRTMEPEVDIVTQQLLAKAGESNNFIREDVERSLLAMVEGVTPKQALLALIGGGAVHKNAVVRRTTAQFLVGVVERMGPGKILSGAKDVTERILPTAAQFVLDGSPETRYYGRHILYLLMSHRDFDRMLTRYLPANTLRNIQDVVENLKNKGLGEKPSDTASARSRRSGQGSRSGSFLRGGSAKSDVEGVSNTPPTRQRLHRTDEATMDEIKALITHLASGEWRVRYDAVSAFQEMCVERPDTVSLHIVKIFDKFLPRLQDANVKVNLHALKVMLQVVPLVKEALQSVISMAITAVVPNLASKNRQISDTAGQILDTFLEHLDHAVLIQPFSSQAQSATGQSKAEMVMKVAYLTERLYERRSKQIMLHVLPLLWHLLSMPGLGRGPASGEVYSATVALASTLYSHMGQSLLDKAGSEPSMTARHMDMLQEVL